MQTLVDDIVGQMAEVLRQLHVGSKTDSTLKGLTILVARHGSHGTWAWEIWRDGKKLAEHDPVLVFNEDELSAKLEAVAKAAEILRLEQDPKDILAPLEWVTFGTESPATQK